MTAGRLPAHSKAFAMSITAVDATTSTTTTKTDQGLASLQSEDFFKILVTELQQQDPFEPAKTADMIGQVSQIRSIELSKNLTDALTQLTQQQHTAGTGELLGKFVTATVHGEDGSEAEISGIVTGVRFGSDGAAVLELDTGQTVLAADVTRIAAAETLDALPETVSEDDAESEDNAEANGQSNAADKSEQTSKGLLSWLGL